MVQVQKSKAEKGPCTVRQCRMLLGFHQYLTAVSCSLVVAIMVDSTVASGGIVASLKVVSVSPVVGSEVVSIVVVSSRELF